MNKTRKKSALHKFIVKIFFFIKNQTDYIYGIFFMNTFATGKKIFLVGTPEHDNLGDHAIALAEEKFINEYFADYSIVEISVESWRKYIFVLKRCVTDQDMFFFTGGGNLGNIYLPDEKLRRKLIKMFPNNKSVIFPQTEFFTSDYKGKNELKKSRKVYELSKRLLICAREEVSFQNLKQDFPHNKIALFPDIVFSLEIPKKEKKKNGKIGICIREDQEGLLSFTDKEFLFNIVEKDKTEFFTTCDVNNVASIERREKIQSILETISTFDFIITDRLHALIFSTLVSTPCLVLPVKSSKITSTLLWLKNVESVVYLNNIKLLPEKLDLIKNISLCQKNNNNNIYMQKYFLQLAMQIEEL